MFLTVKPNQQFKTKNYLVYQYLDLTCVFHSFFCVNPVSIAIVCFNLKKRKKNYLSKTLKFIYLYKQIYKYIKYIKSNEFNIKLL